MRAEEEETLLATGIVVRAYSGFYYVRRLADESAGAAEATRTGTLALGAEFACSLRGKVKKAGEVLVGDYVRFSYRPEEPGKGVIEALLPRRTRLARPTIANVQRLFIVIAVRTPDPQPLLLDRFLVLAAAAGLEPVICFNKIDLLSGRLDWRPIRALEELYRSCGYLVLETSAKYRRGVRRLRQELKGYVSALAGPSGVGKSHLLNALCPQWRLATGEVSAGTGRGRHTTRFAQLLPLDEATLVADTPGFTALDLPELAPADLAGYFPEMRPYLAECRFRDCLHQKESGCRVKEAVAAGAIAPARYQHYLVFLEELQEREAKKWR